MHSSLGRNKGVFLDRDGVLNYPVFNLETNQYEAPHYDKDLKLFPWAIESLQILQSLGFKLFIVTNQPDFAKGKANLEDLKKVHNRLNAIFLENNINFTEYYYCFHHPQGIIKEYSVICECRKPGSFFLKQAELKYNLEMISSWMVGDRDTDIYCGQSVGAKTILVLYEHSKDRSGKSNPNFAVNNLKEAVEIIKKSG